jgi:long-chain acyl-CoA synthetase
MLYERWREVVRDLRNEMALRDLASGQAWTFTELDDRVGSTAEPVVFPQGSAVDFITAVLTGWKTGAVVCPLEPGQGRLAFPKPPKGIVHVKATSASTGPARLAAFTAEQVAADAANIMATMGLRREWPNVGVISLAHSYGFSNLVTPLLLHGIPLVVTNSPLPESIVSALREVGKATLAGVPALWRAWFDAGVLSSRNVCLAISAGAPLPLNLEREVFEQCGIKVHNFYGSTECGGIAYDRSGEPRTDASYAGVPLQDVRLSVGSDGCLEVESRAVGESYWPEGSERLGQGRFRTTDLAEIIEGGIYLRGRASDVINMAGRKISPESIESVLLKHPAVRQCLVFGVSEGDRERIVACVATERTNTGDLQRFLSAHLPAWQLPRDFWFVEELPVDVRGKLSRAALREKYLAR